MSGAESNGRSSLREWLRALVIAVLVLVLIHLFVFRWVTVQSTSMYATLLPDDLVLVQRWPVWTGVERNDIVVFRDPLKDHQPMRKRPLVVKRIVGMPGDTVELRRAVLFVNGEEQALPERATQAHVVRLRSGQGAEEVLAVTELPPSLIQPGRIILELPLNRTLADSLEQLESVVLAESMSLASGAPKHIFPFSERFRWNGDNYGPVVVPAKGDTLRIDVDNFPLYDRIISRYEGHSLSVGRNKLLIDGDTLERYLVEQDYYFVLGDSRHHSADSRYWGFLPGDHLVGRAAYVVSGKGRGSLWSGRRGLLP